MRVLYSNVLRRKRSACVGAPGSSFPPPPPPPLRLFFDPFVCFARQRFSDGNQKSKSNKIIEKKEKKTIGNGLQRVLPGFSRVFPRSGLGDFTGSLRVISFTGFYWVSL